MTVPRRTCRSTDSELLFAFFCFSTLASVSAQRPGRNRIECSADVQFTGTPSNTPRAAPLRGNVGCVDLNVLSMRDLDAMPINRNQEGVNIYGPMEAGFSSQQPRMRCLGDNTISGGIDTNLAEHMVEYLCPNTDITVLDACGGHAMPYHYHERMSCLYQPDPVTKHSTRIGTAGDGHGIYGKHIHGGVEPDDLDACGGRFGITPDSNGQQVYYYSITSSAPFSVGCYGPVQSVQECRDLYPNTCGSGATVETVTTVYGSGQYTLDCPCFDKDQSNVVGQGRPGFLAPLPVVEESETVTTTVPEPIIITWNASDANMTTNMTYSEEELDDPVVVDDGGPLVTFDGDDESVTNVSRINRKPELSEEEKQQFSADASSGTTTTSWTRLSSWVVVAGVVVGLHT